MAFANHKAYSEDGLTRQQFVQHPIFVVFSAFLTPGFDLRHYFPNPRSVHSAIQSAPSVLLVIEHFPYRA